MFCEQSNISNRVVIAIFKKNLSSGIGITWCTDRLRLGDPGSETSQGQGISFFSKRSSRLCDSPGLLFSGCRSRPNFQRVRQVGCAVCHPPPSTHLDLVPELKMNGFMPLLRLYVFMSQIGTTLGFIPSFYWKD